MKYKVLLVLFIISFASSLTLSLKPVSEICDLNKGCEVVHYSQYNFTFGIQNSHYGVFIFLFLILLTSSQIVKPKKNKETAIKVLVIIGSLIAVYFLYIQEFVLNAYCKYCLLITMNGGKYLALIVILSELKEDVKKISGK